jgi:hypothetical protein
MKKAYLKLFYMGYIKQIVVLILTAGSLSFCASKQNISMDFPQEIAAVYFQKTNAEEDQVRTVGDLYIKFDKPLDIGIRLNKIYFRNQVAVLVKVNDRNFVSRFYEFPMNQDLVLDSNPLKEYGNKPPAIEKLKFDLQFTEAVLEYSNHNKTFFYKIKDVEERLMIADPSEIKPKN